jgi:hypothetical protein
MEPKTFFKIILKIFGLFFLKDIIVMIPQLFSVIELFMEQGSSVNQPTVSNGSAGFTIFFIILIFYCFIVYQLLFNTSYILSKLRLDKGFDQEVFSFKFSTASILTVALLVTAGIILTEEIPSFCEAAFFLFQVKSITPNISNPGYSNLVISAVKIILALLLIGERKSIIGWIVKGNTEKQSQDAG